MVWLTHYLQRRRQRKRERRLLRQWQAEVRRVRLVQFPANLALQYWFQNSAETAAAGPERMAWCLALLKPLPPTARKKLIGRLAGARVVELRIRQYCQAQYQRHRRRLVRFLVLKCLLILFKAWRLGGQTRSGRFSKS